MCEPTAHDCAHSCSARDYCSRCDLLVGLKGMHVIEVADRSGWLQVVVESPPAPMGCLACGVIDYSHGRRDVVLVDVSRFGRPTRLVWRTRTWRFSEQRCSVGSFTEKHENLARPRGH